MSLSLSHSDLGMRPENADSLIPSLVPRLPCSGTRTLKLCRRVDIYSHSRRAWDPNEATRSRVNIDRHSTSTLMIIDQLLTPTSIKVQPLTLLLVCAMITHT